MKKRLKIFNSLGVISLLVILAMVLTTVTGSASAERDPGLLHQSLIQSHLFLPDVRPETPASHP
jgi:hypothetical protein